MNPLQHRELTKLIDELKANPMRRADFLRDPVKALSPMIGPSRASSADLGLSNQVLIATMGNPELMDELRGFSVQHESGEIDEATLTQLTASSLNQHLPNDLKRQLNHPALEDRSGLSSPALANIIVHVDIVVLVTQAAVVNSEVVFNGMADKSAVKLINIANLLAKGR